MIKTLFKYVENIWLGTDGKPSARRVLAILFSLNIMSNTRYVIRNWESDDSYADVALLVGVEAGLIAALLSLTTYSAIMNNKNKSSQNEAPE